MINDIQALPACLAISSNSLQEHGSSMTFFESIGCIPAEE